MNTTIQRNLAARKRKIERRLVRKHRKLHRNDDGPVIRGTFANYELSDRTKGTVTGGISLMHGLAKKMGLIDAIDKRLHVLKIHNPYHESDHVLNIAYNALCGGTCLDDIELRRNDEVFLDALGAEPSLTPRRRVTFADAFAMRMFWNCSTPSTKCVRGPGSDSQTSSLMKPCSTWMGRWSPQPANAKKVWISLTMECGVIIPCW